MSHRKPHISMVLVFGIMAVLTMGARPQKYPGTPQGPAKKAI